MGLILKDIHNLDWASGIMMWNLAKARQTKGMADGDTLIADAYHVLFVNYYADTYIFEALDSIKKDKMLYRHKVKQCIGKALDWIHNYDKKVAETMGADYNEKFASMNFNLEDAFANRLKSLEEAMRNALREKGCEIYEKAARIETSILLCEFANANLVRRIEMNRNDNPIMVRLNWVSHKELHPLLLRISDEMKIPNVSKDLTVRSRYNSFEKLWLNETYIADNLGISLLDETEFEAIELGDVIKNSKHNNNKQN